MPGGARGRRRDRLTQAWVRATGRSVHLAADAWLDGPVGDVDRIGTDVFAREAGARGRRHESGGDGHGLLEDLSALHGPGFDAARVDERIRDFHERTSAYEFDAWSKWTGIFRPFGGMLARLFSRRLQQLDVALSPLDTARGITSEVGTVRDEGGVRRYATWVRRTNDTGDALYVGAYSTCRPSGAEGRCIRVVFPPPNGHAAVVMRPEAGADGSFTVRSDGRRFGEAGF